MNSLFTKNQTFLPREGLDANREQLDAWVTRSGTAGDGWRWGKGYRVYRHPDGHYSFRKKSAGIEDLGDPMPKIELFPEGDRWKVTTTPGGGAVGTVVGTSLGVDLGIIMAVYSTQGKLEFSWTLLLILIGLPIAMMLGFGAFGGRTLRKNAQTVVPQLGDELNWTASE